MIALFESLVDILWPRTCVVEGCGRRVERPGRHICDRCRAFLPFFDVEPPHDCAFSMVYLPPIDKLLLDFKFHDAIYLADDFTDFLEEAVRRYLDVDLIDIVMPIPLHPHRRLERGYNQSDLIASRLAKRLGVVYDVKSLIRRQDTEHQTRISGKERYTNLRGAFRCLSPEWVRGKNILLVDDVSTTGSTFAVCIRELHRVGAKRIFCAAVATSQYSGEGG